jgi:hypothetical protein
LRIFLICIGFTCLIFQKLNAQTIADRERINRLDKYLNQPGNNFHTSIKPYNTNELKAVIPFDSIAGTLETNAPDSRISGLFNKDLFKYRKDQVLLRINPVLNVMPGTDLEATGLMEASAGADMYFSFKEKLSFSLTMIEGNSVIPMYLDSFAFRQGALPGYGNARKVNSAFRHEHRSGSLTYSPSPYVDLQAGYGRFFIGDGYRSLLLSDDAYNYPFLNVTTKIWKLKYTNIFTAFDDVRTGRNGYYNKFGAFHYLSWNISPKISMGIFESIIFEARDSTSRFSYDINYLNPVIFYRPVEYSIGSGDNALMGMNLKINFYKSNVIYGQAMIDEFLLREIRADIAQRIRPDPTRIHGWWANKYSLQVGIKMFDLFGIKNLNAQTEYNIVRPYSYTHGSVNQNYGHSNLFLAHPLSANFRESVSFLRYYFKRFSIEGKLIYAVYGEDTPGDYFGRDIYRSYVQRPYEYGHYTTQGIRSALTVKDFKISYLLNPASNIMLVGGVSLRDLNREDGVKQQARIIYGGIRSALYNKYWDR